MIRNRVSISTNQNQGPRFFKEPVVRLTSNFFVIFFTFYLIFLSSSVLCFQKNSKPDSVILEFKDVDLSVFIRFVSDITNKSFVFDERVRGQVTIVSPTKIEIDELYDIFLTVLDFKGYTTLPDGKVIRIVPSGEAKQSSGEVRTEGGGIIEKEGFLTRLVFLKYLKARDAVRILSPLISKNGAITFSEDTNTLVITSSPFNIERLVALSKELDKKPQVGSKGIFVYYLENADSEELAKVLNEIFAKVKPKGKIPSRGSPNALKTPVHIETREITGTISITADQATNSLIIHALLRDYEILKKVIKDLDVRRKQVFVEAAIMEISLKKLKELGFEFRLLNDFSSGDIKEFGGTNFGNIGPAASGPSGLANISGLAVGVTEGVFSFGGREFLNIAALISALEIEDGVNILSTPQILTTDNKQAEIVVGENVPVITGQTVTDGGNTQSSVERMDVGVTLRLTPHITEGSFIRLDIYQEISSLIQSVFFDPNVVGPLISKRFAETTVVTKDGETIVIAGLIRDNKTTQIQKVPILGDIPILGYLFRFEREDVDKTNLLVFLTPTIVKDETILKNLTKEKKKKLKNIQDENPHGS